LPQRRALADERFDVLEGQVVPNPGGGWLFVLEGGAYYSAPDFPDDAALIGDLHPLPNPTISDVPYFAWLDRVTPFVNFWKSIGRWATPRSIAPPAGGACSSPTAPPPATCAKGGRASSRWRRSWRRGLQADGPAVSGSSRPLAGNRVCGLRLA
jgi:hypothetical protein